MVGSAIIPQNCTPYHAVTHLPITHCHRLRVSKMRKKMFLFWSFRVLPEYFLSTTCRLFKGGAFEFVKQSWILRVLVGHFKLWYDVSMATTRISANQSAITLFALVGVQKSVIALWLVRRSAITKIIALWRVIQSLWQCVIGMWL